MLQARSWLPRTEGALRLAFRQQEGRTALDILHQAGAARARFPKPASDDGMQAVLVNMAGGLTGGDRFDIAVDLAASTSATVTTAAAEKVYRARDSEAAAIQVRIGLESGAELAWLPQPTILFDAARLDRRTEIDLAPDARFLAVETLIFGRTAMGEEVNRGYCRDAWRLRRGGRLVFADTLRLDGAVAEALSRPAALGGAHAAAFVLFAAPDAPSRLQTVRALCEGAKSILGVSSWNNLLVVRAIAGDGSMLQGDIAPVLELLSGRPLPRVWQC